MTKKIILPKLSENKKTSQIPQDNFKKQKPSWRFTYCDLDSKYSMRNCTETIFDKLKSFESMTFDEIFYKNQHNNHRIKDKSKMLKFVLERLSYLKLSKDLEIYSLRLEGDMRIYGFIESNIFYILWYDPKHELYPVAKKHT